jgi:putative transposase
MLARAGGAKEEDVAATTGVSLNTVSLWSKRFEEEGLAGLVDKAGRGRKPSLPAEKVRQAITTVTQPPPGRQRWSTRSMGAALGISHQSVQTIWTRNDLKPHLTHFQNLQRSPI